MKLLEKKSVQKNIVLFLLVITALIFIYYIVLYNSNKSCGVKLQVKKSDIAYFPEYMYNNSNYAPKKGKGFGVSVQDLEQSNSFYSKHRAATLKYLSGVYPNGMDSLEALGDLELASFFNSLTYYYNCDFQYDGNDLDSNNGMFPDKWDALPCSKDYPLPYPPQGWFYDWSAFNELNVPYSYSDSSGDKKRLRELGSCRPGIAFQTFGPKSRAGPGTMWVNCRAAIRHAYHPRGIINTASIPPKKDGKYMWPVWSRYNVTDNRNIPFDYPWGWQSGIHDYGFIEICHTQPTPGMVESLGFWFNCMPGTGMFLNVGKSFRAHNKVSALFNLLGELRNKNPTRLKKHFGGLTDPYMICWYQFAYCGYETKAGFKENTFCQWRYVNCNNWCIPDSLAAGKYIGNQTPRRFYDDVIDYSKMMGIKLNKDGSPSYEGIKAALDACMEQTNYTLSRMPVSPLCDEPCFFVASLLGYDTIQYTLDPIGNGYYNFELQDCRVPVTEKFSNIKEEILDRDYSSFVGNKRTGKNGKLGPLPVVVPQGSDSASYNYYYKEFIDAWFKKLKNEKIITIRDPLDIYNEDKVDICIGIEFISGQCPNNTSYDKAWYNLTCDKIPIASAYRCLQLGQDAGDSLCKTTGNNPTC